MSIASLNAAFADQLGIAGTLVGSSLHYLDGGRVQLIATTLIDQNGQRQTIIRPFTGTIDVAASAKQMALDWQSGALPAIVTDGPDAEKTTGPAVFVSTPALAAGVATSDASSATK